MTTFMVICLMISHIIFFSMRCIRWISWMMKAIHLLLLNIVAQIAAAKYHSICPSKLLESKEGDNVTLQCFLQPTLSLSAHTVEWKRADQNKVVHLYRHRKDDPDPQMGQYKNRTNLNHEDLGRGVLDLKLSSVQLSDSGQYRCNVPKLEVTCVITLIVEKRVQKNQTDNGDSRPTQPPQKDVTQPSNRGAEQISINCGAIVVVSIILLLFIGLKRKAIKKCTEQLRGRKRPEPEVAAGGSTGEMLDPTSGEASDNLKKPAENRSENIIYSEA